MKKIIFTIFAAFILVNAVHAQWGTVGSTSSIANTNTGNVGVGTGSTTAPVSLFTVQGPGTIGSIYQAAITDGTNFLKFDVNGSSAEIQAVGSSHPLYINWSGNNTIIDGQNSGMVGVGTNSPNGKMEVYASVSNSPNGLVLNEGNSSSNLTSARLYFSNSFDITVNSFSIYKNGSNLLFGTAANPGTNSGTTAMALSSAGHLGIGTTTIPPGYSLAVNGSEIATAITVQLNSLWPDYVFNRKYVLTPLNDVKMFINQNHRLPGMPSASQIEKQGVNLGEMDKLLTKKIEELTLYLVDSNDKQAELLKEVQTQQKQIDEQKSQIDRLTKLVNELVKDGVKK